MGGPLACARGSVRSRPPIYLGMRVAGERHYGCPGLGSSISCQRSVGRGSEHLAARDGGALLLEQDYVDTSWTGWKPVLRGSQEAGVGLRQAGGATDETSDFGQ